jgi:hypothetical protein
MCSADRWELSMAVLSQRVCALSVLLTLTSGYIHAQSTYAGDNLRSGWYPFQTVLTPPTVGSSVFGKVFDTPVVGQVYAQPVLSGNTMVIVTESNWAYGLDALTGTERWSRNFGPAFNASDIGCSDLTPAVGITGTPAIDKATNTVYFLSKNYLQGSRGPAGYFMHALDVFNGSERDGFPVQITGNAQNDPSAQFDATFHLNRVSLLLMDGVVYAGFGAMCDVQPFKGWIVGVSTAKARITALWTASPGTSGAGLWQSGAALVSDGPDRIFVVSGNGYASTPDGKYASDEPPSRLAESVIRLHVQPDGTLKADNFFSPYDAPSLDNWDADLGSGGPVALPDGYFGTTSHPHLMMLAGKQGYVYLLDRDHLGGQRMGPGGSDDVISRVGPYGGVWSRPSVWPGDGGHLFLVSASSSNNPSPTGGQLRSYAYGVDGAANPSLTLEASSVEPFGSYSSSTVVTSDGISSGSALVWLINVPDGSGNNAHLMAYDATPVAGHFRLRFSAPIGQASKFTPPGVGPDRIYVGTRDGHILGFGVPAKLAVSAPSTQFGDVSVGTSANRSFNLTANTSVTVQSVSISNPDFAVSGMSSPATLASGEVLRLTVTFTPSHAGLDNSIIHVATNLGDLDFVAVGRGFNPQAQLQVFPSVLSLGGVSIGGMIAGNVTLSNIGGEPLTIQNLIPPDSPFKIDGVPPTGSKLGPGQTVSVTVRFAPALEGLYVGVLHLSTSAGDADVKLSATSTRPGALAITGQNLNFGSVAVGSSSSLFFTIKNSGASSLSITKSKPPSSGSF